MTAKIAIVIPSYKVRRHILKVLSRIGPEVWRVYVVDDCCPEASGEFVRQNCQDERVHILRNEENQGVGGAVLTGYRQAIADGADVIVKIDGDGQMDPRLVKRFVAPILSGTADYTKGNRFYDLEDFRQMPRLLIMGNAALSFLAKLSTGYWNIFDPNNGFTAVHASVARHLPLKKISRRYFFETDILFRLNTLRAAVLDIPMTAVYSDEISNMKLSFIVFEFLFKHCKNFLKRVFYSYFLREMSIATLELAAGILLLLFGTTYGGYHWLMALRAHTTTPAGTVMLSALPVLLGLQLLLAFFGFDIANVPKHPIHPNLAEPDNI